MKIKINEKETELFIFQTVWLYNQVWEKKSSGFIDVGFMKRKAAGNLAYNFQSLIASTSEQKDWLKS